MKISTQIFILSKTLIMKKDEGIYTHIIMEKKKLL